MKDTDIEKVRESSKLLFDLVEIKDAGFGIAQHPFTNTTIQVVSDDSGTPKLVDLTKDDQYKKFRKQQFELIDKASLDRLFIMVNDSYNLTWFYFVKEYLNEQDYAKYLVQSWIMEEDPNNDINCDVKMSIKLFKNANKELIMDEQELEKYNSIPELVKLYRGVTKGRNPLGLSYTDDRRKAEWFSNRFGNGYVIELEVKKEDVIAYINQRGEKEFVIDSLKYKKLINKGLL